MSEISGGITLRRSGAGPAQQSERGRPNYQTDQGSCKRRISARRSRPGAGAGGRGAAAAAAGCASAATSSFLLPKGHISFASNHSDYLRLPPVLPCCDPAKSRSDASRQICEDVIITQVRSCPTPFLALPCVLGGWGFAFCLQSPIRSRGRLPGGVGFFK